jgi:hypothetical protein
MVVREALSADETSVCRFVRASVNIAARGVPLAVSS